MKRFILLTMVLLLILPMTAMAAEDVVTPITTGYEDVLFSNGYRGFCLDNKKDGAYSGDTFTVTNDTSAATSNTDNSDISQKLKILFTQCFEDIFVSDGNGGYQLKEPNAILYLVWHYTDNFYISPTGTGTQSVLLRAIEGYTGPAIPDNGYALALSNGDTVTFSFIVLAPSSDAVQHFFAYNISVASAGDHTHDFGETWESDDSQHWYACACGEKSDITPHTPTVINEKPASEFEAGYTGDTVCSSCSRLLAAGETVPATHQHVYGETWKSDDNQHWYECPCGEKKDIDNHNAVLVNQKEATELEEGYTGDTVCETCEKLIREGEPIDKLPGSGHSHAIPEQWDSNETQHWKECPCGEKLYLANHAETVINQKAASTTEEGYTGDTVCETCGKVIKTGQAIPKTHGHSFGSTWKTSATQHWHECACGEKADAANHIYKDGYCTVCKHYNPNYRSDNPNTGDSFSPALHIALCLMSVFGFAWVSQVAKKKGMF